MSNEDFTQEDFEKRKAEVQRMLAIAKGERVEEQEKKIPEIDKVNESDKKDTKKIEIATVERRATDAFNIMFETRTKEMPNEVPHKLKHHIAGLLEGSMGCDVPVSKIELTGSLLVAVHSAAMCLNDKIMRERVKFLFDRYKEAVMVLTNPEHQWLAASLAQDILLRISPYVYGDMRYADNHSADRVSFKGGSMTYGGLNVEQPKNDKEV
jgi:hypothetical protein